MALCRCSKLYQSTKPCTQPRADNRFKKGFSGYSGRYFKVRNSEIIKSEKFNFNDEVARWIDKDKAIKEAFIMVLNILKNV